MLSVQELILEKKKATQTLEKGNMAGQFERRGIENARIAGMICKNDSNRCA
jgi:hypothetical protein